MVTLSDTGVYLIDGKEIVPDGPGAAQRLEKLRGKLSKEEARRGTMTYSILNAHNRSVSMERPKLRFDALTSHDLTYVGVIQTAKASGLSHFPIPYVLTNCHNSLCAVGGTLNEDDHMFGLSAAKKYGGIYVPQHLAVIHQYMREMHAACGKMVLGSDSHTRYGALGTLAVGEGGGELVKQLLGKTYDIPYPGVVGVFLRGKPRPGVGPQDIALAIIGAVFKNGYVKNKVMEFFGDGIANLSMDFRFDVDVMTTETTCLSSVWKTDGRTKDFLSAHGREKDYAELRPGKAAYYDGLVTVELDAVEPMIALPFHPSNVYTIRELNANLPDILRKVELDAARLFDNQNVSFSLTDKITDGKLKADQGVIAGCDGGTFENLVDAASIVQSGSLGSDEFALSVYPSSQPVLLELVRNGTISDLASAGATVRTAFCGPCFGAGDIPANNGLSIRHTTRNFPNREGSKPNGGQIASVALMDARSIAASAINGGFVTAATDLEIDYRRPDYHFDGSVYEKRVYNGFSRPREDEPLKYGPNIIDWPAIGALEKHLLLSVASFIIDPVTTTDELIPSGETSTYRSNPTGMAEFTLSRKDPGYVGRAKAVHELEKLRAAGKKVEALSEVYGRIRAIGGFEDVDPSEIGIGSAVYAVKPGDGSAREQAASCQRVLGGAANIAREYATKRYRNNLVNWGMIPFTLGEDPAFKNGDYLFVPDIRSAVLECREAVTAYLLGEKPVPVVLSLGGLEKEESEIIAAGCLINYYRKTL